MDFDYNFIKGYYKKHLKEYGEEDIRGMAWFEEEEFSKRFVIASKIGDLNTASILDVGCGFGELYRYLKQKGIKNFSYLGIDIVPEMIKAAKKKNPDASFKFLDILKENPGKFDFVFCIGALNIEMENHKDFFNSMLDSMINLARKGVSVCFLSDKEALEDGPYYFHDPNEAKKYCESKYNVKVKILKEAFVPGESFLFVYKD